MHRKVHRTQQREVLLLLSLDSNRLRQKELLSQRESLSHRLQEMAEAEQFRQTGSLPPPMPPRDPNLDRALGLSTPPL